MEGCNEQHCTPKQCSNMKKRMHRIQADKQPISSWVKLNPTMPLILVLFLLPVLACSQGILEIPFMENIHMDGSSADWKNNATLRFPSSNNAGLWEKQGDFTKAEDLQVEIKMVWNKKGLCFYVAWEDDFIDEKRIPKDSATVKTPSGRRMDRMYLYDNLKIQIRTKTRNYSSWFAPRENALQWFSLREQKDGKSSTLQTTAPLFKSIQRLPNKYTLEIQYPWTGLHVTPEATVDLLVIINDTDQKGKTNVKERLRTPRKYISISKKLLTVPYK